MGGVDVCDQKREYYAFRRSSKNVEIQTDDIHIPDLFPFIDSVVGFNSFGSTRV